WPHQRFRWTKQAGRPRPSLRSVSPDWLFPQEQLEHPSPGCLQWARSRRMAEEFPFCELFRARSEIRSYRDLGGLLGLWLVEQHGGSDHGQRGGKGPPSECWQAQPRGCGTNLGANLGREFGGGKDNQLPATCAVRNVVEEGGTFGAKQRSLGEGSEQVWIGVVWRNVCPQPATHDFGKLLHVVTGVAAGFGTVTLRSLLSFAHNLLS